ncbi:related to NAD-dependent histone deacetylases [Cephalotrichum gorgonifer]|uniref:Related to NAD-dependent histone deacetylases n=1 Tax=Cephalotrichum gorgonifer TaxID=2041049 RepID=A0AAE8SR75_9PEZI|nr:related to NAD-dependent histone deacetylases [Cephalotrichum gorgonifer]
MAGHSFDLPYADDREARQSISTPPDSTSPSSIHSSPLSILSKSPSLPGSPHESDDPGGRYPSPSASSLPSGTQSPLKPRHNDRDEIRVNTTAPTPRDGQPPPKKRKITQPKTRTTEHLDLSTPNLDDKTSDEAMQLNRLLNVIRKKKKIVVIAGAGISVSAGIPDFRSNSGLFTTLKAQHKIKGASGKHLFDAAVYRHDASTQSFHTMVRELSTMTSKASPTPFHHLLASLAAEGRLLRLYTQNVDCIDTNLPPLATTVPLNTKAPWPVTIQLHGGLEKMVCTKCGDVAPLDGDKFTSHEAPLCQTCQTQEHLRVNFANKRSQGVGRMRPRIVLYNEANPDEEAIGSVSMADLRSRPDAVIVVGTSLKIPGVRRLVKELCQVTRGRRDGFSAWINVDPVPLGAEFRDCWDLVVRGKCDDVAFHAQLPRWDEEGRKARELSAEDNLEREKMLKRSKLEVRLSPESGGDADAALDKRVEHVQGIPTPGASPRLSAVKVTKTQSKLSFANATAATEKKPARKSLPDKPNARKPGPKSKRAAPQSHTVKDVFRTVKAGAATPNAKGGNAQPASVPEKREHSEFVDDDSELSSVGSASPDMPSTVLPPLRPISVREGQRTALPRWD